MKRTGRGPAAGGEEHVDTEPARARHLIQTDPYQKLAALSSLAQKRLQKRSVAELFGRVHRLGRWPHGA